MLMNHHSLFTRISRLDRPLLFLNLLLLMAIVFLPFSTAQLGANILVPQDAPTAASFYAASAVLIAVFFSALWAYLFTHPDLLSPDVDREAALRSWPRFSIGLLAYLICVPLGQVSPIGAIVVCASMAVYYAFDRFQYFSRPPAEAL